MYIKDYDFIDNIDVLFERSIIIYGAGDYGKIVADLLEDISLKIECFCDKRIIGEYLGYPVIKMEELKEKTDSEKCLIIIGSLRYCDEIAKELQENQINAYVCSWYGLRVGLEIHIEDERIPKEFAEDFMFTKAVWTRSYNQLRILPTSQMYFCVHPETVLIYQSGKVGSSTILASLRKEDIDAHHLHYMRHEFQWTKEWLEYTEIFDAEFSKLISTRRKSRIPVKMIIGVREPIARALAEFMHLFTDDYLNWYKNDRSLQENALAHMKKRLDEDWAFRWWFDRELKEVTGIDVYEYPFDREKGYAWIKNEGIEILLYKLEKLNENVDVIGEFVGRPGLTLVNNNVGDEKQYRYIYEELRKRIRIPAEVIEEQYQNPRFLHFYTEKEKENFVKKWIGEP